MDIGQPRRIIEIQPILLPVPGPLEPSPPRPFEPSPVEPEMPQVLPDPPERPA